MNKADILLGLQWGDEGKGKVVDVLSERYDVIARFQGGPNAGHSLVFGGKRHVLHTIPSGIFRSHTQNLIGNGVVIDPIGFKKECEGLVKAGVNPEENLYVSERAHLILPTHKVLDAASEWSKGKGKIGSTLRGIGPTYMDKTGRNGMRVGDVNRIDFKEKYALLRSKHLELIQNFGYSDYDLPSMEELFFEGISFLKTLKRVSSEYFITDSFLSGKKILAEGAQGTLLDIEFGSYPFVTSSHTVAAGACIGLGISPSRIGEVIGIFKAYCTRVGSGPFPTELHDDVGERIRKAGNEFGSTTGRPRRCGWLDLPALKYAIMLNGVSRLAMMKSDVLNHFEEVKICVGYEINGKPTERIPFSFSNEMVRPIYKSFRGWGDTSVVAEGRPLPDSLEAFIVFIENEVKVPITMVSLGPERENTCTRHASF